MRAMADADELGMRPLIARCHLGLGMLYRRTAERVRAQEHLATAIAQFCAMRMQPWLTRAREETAALSSIAE
jgi:hypothetical protein